MKLLFIILVFLTISCTSIKNEDALYVQYNAYTKTKIDTSNYTMFFSKTITDKINSTNISQLSFVQYMSKEIKHYSKHNNKNGCLTINGFNSSNKPVSFYLEYSLFNSTWLISDIDVSFKENTKEFIKKPLCPSDTRQK